MPVLTEIKNAILSLGSGEFQNLCDAFLNECGYSNIVCLGTKAGTAKTTLGTPDTYCCKNPYGKYIFIEYTTQQDKIDKKILGDIKKCIDFEKTGIPTDLISEIMYFHTSSNLKPEQDNNLKVLCSNCGILLEIYGIDRLANELFNDHKYLLHDYLGISVSTEQIFTVSDFISVYNKAKTAAPLNTAFMFREDEINFILEMLNKNKMVLISGIAGVGKTRIALECGKRFAEIYGCKFYCVKNNNQRIYEDLYQFFNKPDNYLILLDDANELSELDSIIEFFISKEEDYSFKIIVTVRHYALEYVERMISAKIDYKKYNLKPFQDAQILELIEKEMKVTDLTVLSQISRISNGNARIAFLAGKQFVETKTFDSIYNVLDLYKSYFGRYLNEIDISQTEIWKTAAITAFLGATNIDYLSSFSSVLSIADLSESVFIEKLHELHRKEIIDIYKNKAIIFSDQCMSNYILYFAFVERKLISLSQVIEELFKINPKCVVRSVYLLVNLFYSDETKEFVYKEIKTVWNELRGGDKVLFFKYVKAFYIINQIDALLIIKEKIDETMPCCINFEKSVINRSNLIVNDDILTMLCGFANSENIDVALDLYCAYYDKRQDLIQEFYSSAIKGFGITKINYESGCIPTIMFVERLTAKSDNWSKPNIAHLFIEIASYLLKFEFNDTEMVNEDRINYISFSLRLTDGVKKIREEVWLNLLAIYEKNEFNSSIENLLNDYSTQYCEEVRDIVVFEMEYVIKIYSLANDKETLRFCRSLKSLTEMYDFFDIDYDERLSEYLQSNKYKLFKTFCRPDISDDIPWEKKQEEFRKNIYDYLKSADIGKIYELIDFFCFEKYEYDYNEAINYAFDVLYELKTNYIEALVYYIKKDYEVSTLREDKQITHLFDMMTDKEVWSFISTTCYNNANKWQYYYFEQLPICYIDKQHLDAWYEFLENDSDEK